MDIQDSSKDPRQPATSEPEGLPPDASEMLRECLRSDGPSRASLLEQRFPHVVRRIEALWGTDDIYRFLDALIPAGGARCRGFPPEVEAEIRRFQAEYLERFPAPAKPEPPATPAAAEPPPAEPSGGMELDSDYDIWKNERRLRGWDERSIF